MIPVLQKVLNRFGLFSKRQMQAMTRNTGWQAAAVNRLTQAWTTQTLSVDSNLRRELPILRARSRQVAANNDYGIAFFRMLRCNVLGDYGVAMKNKARDMGRDYSPGELDKRANAIIEEEWYKWGKRGFCTVDRQMSWCDLQNLVLETIAKDGEVLIRKVRGFDNPHRFALQIIEADYLDVEKNEVAGENQIRMGVQLNGWHEPTAYWLLRRHPNDNLYTDPTILDNHYRVSAQEILHPFIRCRPHQTRGIPWTATALYRMNMLGKYEEAEVTAARAAASKMAFLLPSMAGVDYKGEELHNGVSMDAEPGAIEQLPAGMDIKALDWNHPNSSYEVFMKAALRGVASGLGVSYNTLGNDMQSVNFASGRLGLDMERDSWKAIQRWFIESVINPIFEEWLDIQLLSGKIPLPYSKFDKFNAPDWMPRRWGFVNPVDDVKARIEAIRAGLTSRSRVLAEQGLDQGEINREIKADNEDAEELGLEFPALTDGLEEQEPAAPPLDEAHSKSRIEP